MELVQEKINTGIYKQSTSSGSSTVFCVAKHDGKLRIDLDLQEMNKVTIKDAGLLSATEKFVEAFAGRSCYGLGDIMGGYDERGLLEHLHVLPYLMPIREYEVGQEKPLPIVAASEQKITDVVLEESPGVKFFSHSWPYILGPVWNHHKYWFNNAK